MERCCSGILRLTLCAAELSVHTQNKRFSIIKSMGRNLPELNPSCRTSLHCSTCDVSKRGGCFERIPLLP